MRLILLATLTLFTARLEVGVTETRQVDMTFDGYLRDIQLEEEEPDEQIEGQWEIPCSSTSTFKSYMDYRHITNTSSKQWTLQEDASTVDGYRIYKDRKMVAMAGYEVGQELDLELSSGEILKVVIGDLKGGTACLHGDGSMVEFVVDESKMDPYVREMGDFNVVHEGYVKRLKKGGLH